MGLDSVEMVLAIEEEFGLEFPDVDAERITTVGDAYDYIRARLKSVPAEVCLTQRIFHKLRRALMANYGFIRSDVTLEMRLSDRIPPKALEEGWPFLELFAELKLPPFEEANRLKLIRLMRESITLRELIQRALLLNYADFNAVSPNDEEIWARLASVIMRQLNVTLDQIKPEASFTKDLGLD